MKLLSKIRVAAATPQGSPLCGCITYINPVKPILFHRMARQIASDTHDSFYDTFSYDNGLSWSEPRVSSQHKPPENASTHYVENTVFYDAERNRVVHMVDEVARHSSKQNDVNRTNKILITIDEPQAFISGSARTTLATDFGFEQGIGVSLCHPYQDVSGRLLVPVQYQREDPAKKIADRGFPLRSDLPNVLKDVWQCALLAGTWNDDHTLSWQLGHPVPYDFDTTSRGLCEGTVTELESGRLVMVLRGSNVAWPEKPGYKWVSFSEDGGLNWSQAEPLACDDGTSLESSATGSALFRSEKNGRLYWIGNLCINGERANGNWPRSPLVIAEIQEEPFRLIRESITLIDQRAPGEPETVQHSNFKFYQERDSGDAILYLTRFGERGHDQDKWLDADLYQYRIELDACASGDTKHE